MLEQWRPGWHFVPHEGGDGWPPLGESSGRGTRMRNPFKPKPVTKSELAAYRRGRPVRPAVAEEAARLGLKKADHTDAARALRAARGKRR